MSIHISLTPRLRAAIDAYENCADKFGRLEFDFNEDGTVEFDLKIPSYTTGAIFRDISHFIDSTPSILKGDFRENFYIVSLDYFSEDIIVPAEIKSIRKVTEFIHSLREFVALSIDRDQAMNGGKIFFLKPSDGKSPQKAATLKINFNEEALEYKLEGFSILKALANPVHKENKTQMEERILLMNTAISQIIDECEDDDADFIYLLKNWNKVNKKYLHDLHAYVSAFSFDAVKKRISDGLLESSTKINNAIGEVGTKLLAVPASMGALIVIVNSSGYVSLFLGILGVVIASLIILRTIWHYENQIENLIESFSFNMKEATKAKKTFSGAIQKEINRLDIFQKKQKESIFRSFLFYKFLAFLPIVASLYFIIDAMLPFLYFEHYLYKYCLTFNIR